MRFVMSLFFLLPLSASAEHLNLLNCNTPAGPTQQVTVRQEIDGSLTLIELLGSGKQVRRALSQEEWASESLQLHTEAMDENASLKKVVDGWWYEAKDVGGSISGYADCWEDEISGG